VLDAVCAHILSINRANIDVSRGNYSTWKENNDRREARELSENARLKKDITRLKTSAKRVGDWSESTESSKIGSHLGDRGFVGHKAAKMMSKAKNIERRKEQAAEDKSKLLKNVEITEEIIIKPLAYHKNTLIEARNFQIIYDGEPIFSPVSFKVSRGERLAFSGGNGAGKSSIIRLIIGEKVEYSGEFSVAGGLEIAYVKQSANDLSGSLRDFADAQGVDEVLLKSALRKLGFEREKFDSDIADFSEGQKKKTALAASLCRQAHLYIWDEPLNFIDILSHAQIIEAVLEWKPTLVFTEHDAFFTENVATEIVILKR
jgi:lincosamide and streptogramin A transport system ATP-binding/permease protein